MAEYRVQKVLADQGICSRREAERLIAAGKVKVNASVPTSRSSIRTSRLSL